MNHPDPRGSRVKRHRCPGRGDLAGRFMTRWMRTPIGFGSPSWWRRFPSASIWTDGVARSTGAATSASEATSNSGDDVDAHRPGALGGQRAAEPLVREPTANGLCRPQVVADHRGGARALIVGQGRPSAPDGRPVAWANVGRRVGSLGHLTARFNGVSNKPENLCWSSLRELQEPATTERSLADHLMPASARTPLPRGRT